MVYVIGGSLGLIGVVVSLVMTVGAIGSGVMAKDMAAAPAPQATLPLANKGQEACQRADLSWQLPPEVRAPSGAAEALNPTSAIEHTSAVLKVQNIQDAMDQATLSGHAELVNKLRGDLDAAKRDRAGQEAATEHRLAVLKAHDAALQDIADCRKFRGE
jgi:hypothetical protein